LRSGYADLCVLKILMLLEIGEELGCIEDPDGGKREILLVACDDEVSLETQARAKPKPSALAGWHKLR